MARPRTFDLHAIDDLARAQGGVVTHAQLVELGMAKSTISTWTRTGGRWQRLLPATYLVHRGTPTAAERLHAGLLYAGPRAVLTGGVGAHLLGLRNLPGAVELLPVHLLVPVERHVKSAAFVVVERTQRMPEPTLVGGFPVAPMARVVFDVGRRTQSRSAIRALTLEAVQRGLLDIDDLAHEIRSGQRQWTALMRDVLGDAVAGTRSAPEAGLRGLVRASDLPEPLWNPTLETLGGEFIAEPDGYYEDLGMALEVDSRKYHYTDETNYEQTWRRHGRFNRHRILAERIMPKDITEDPAGVVAAIKATREANAGRQVPQIRVIPSTSGSSPRPGGPDRRDGYGAGSK